MLAIVVFGSLVALVIGMFVHSVVSPMARAPSRSARRKREDWTWGIHGSYAGTPEPVAPPIRFAPEPPAVIAVPTVAAPATVLPLPPLPEPAPLKVHRELLSPEPVEHDLLSALRDVPGDEYARMVYADWLEQHGRLAHASFVRHVNHPSDDLLDIIAESDVAWRAITSRKRFTCSTLACPRNWDALAAVLHDERSRRCTTCGKIVRYCETADDVRGCANRGERALLDVAGQAR